MFAPHEQQAVPCGFFARAENNTNTHHREETPSVAFGTGMADGAEGSDSTEEALVQLARQGDLEAFGILIQRHHNACLKRAMLMIRNRSDAEDEVQNAYWKAFQRLEQFRGEG